MNRVDSNEKYAPQIYKETCQECKPYGKYGTTRLVKIGERVCSVCGKSLTGVKC